MALVILHALFPLPDMAKQTIARAKTKGSLSQQTHGGEYSLRNTNGCGFSMPQMCRICAFHNYVNFCFKTAVNRLIVVRLARFSILYLFAAGVKHTVSVLRWRDTVRPLYSLGACRVHAEVSQYRDCPSPVTSSQK